MLEDPKVQERLYAASPLLFATECLRGPPEAPYHGRFLVGPHHLEWERLSRDHKKLAILAPRDHGKTFFFSYVLPIWRSIYWPGREGYIFSSTQPLANEILDDIRIEIEENPKLTWLIPPKKRKWSASCLRFTNGSTIYAAGWQTKVRGGHPFWADCDDVLTDESLYSDTIRRKQINYFHSVITNMVVDDGYTTVIGCVTEDTWVATEDGLRRIGDLNPGGREAKSLHPIDLGIEGLPGIQRAHKFWVNGECPTKRVTLEGQYRLEGSYRHPLYVMGEDGEPCWRRSDEVQSGDFVAVKAGLSKWGLDPETRYAPRPKENILAIPARVSVDLAYLLGLWTVEGSYEPTGRVMVSNTDPEIQEWLLGAPFGMQFKPHQDGHTLRCSAHGFLRVVENLGGVLGTAPKKIVPAAIMGGSREVAVEFLRGLFDGDGNVYVRGRNQQVMLGTTSEFLARDAQTLLLNLGIVSIISKRPPAKPTKRAPGGGRYPLWVVRMTGGEAYRFMGSVGFRLSRKQSAQVSMDPEVGCRFRGIPHQGPHVAIARKEKPERSWPKEVGSPSVNLSEIARKERPCRSTLRRAVERFERHGSCGEGVAKIRRNLERDDLVWLKVIDIEDRTAFTVDFVIGGDHSFVTNGIVSHNTPFHRRDLLYGNLKENPVYVWKQFKALSGPKEDQPLWPARFPLKRLLERKLEIGSIRFSREFQTNPISDDSSLFPSWLFAGEPVEQRSLRLGMPLEYWQELGVTIFIGVDLAMSASAGGDYFVIFVMGIDGYKNRWIIEIIRKHGIGFQEQLNLINGVGKRYDPAIVAIESNQLQRVWGDELIRTSDLPIQKFVTTAQKHTLEHGLPSLRIRLENRKWRIPRGDKRSVELTDVWEEELQAHAWVDGKVQCVTGHDDVAMASWITDQTAQKGAFSFGVGEATGAEGEDAEIEALVRELQGEFLEEPGAAVAAAEVMVGGSTPDASSKQPAGGSLMDDLDVPMGKTLDQLFGGMPGLGGY